MRWIIGDIHGMLKLLTRLVDAVYHFDPQAELIFVGDYVNRGPDSNGVIEYLMSLDKARYCRGNHDDIFDLILHGQCYAENGNEATRIAALRWFLAHGLDRTLMSYGADPADLEFTATHPSTERLQKIVDLVPSYHREFIRNLPGVIDFDDIFVAHAKWGIEYETDNPGVHVELSLDPLLRHNIIWGRYHRNEVTAEKAWQRTGYFGHTPVSHYLQPDAVLVPVLGPQIVLLDTAAALSSRGRLTAVCAETQEFIQVDHFGELIQM